VWVVQVEAVPAADFPAAVDAAEPDNLAELTEPEVAQLARARTAAKDLADEAAGALLGQLEADDAGTITVQVKQAEL
jgi:hypothetical protein